MRDKKKTYLPDERNTLGDKSKELKKINDKSKINLPDPSEDDIVANNIAYQEFDYTEDQD